MSRIVFYRVVLILWILGIFYVSLSANPKKDFPLYVSLGPFALHVIAFSVLFVLFYLSFNLSENKIILRVSSFFCLTVSVSLVKELAQLFVRGRTFSLEDILVDAGSALIVAVIIGTLEWKATCLRHQL